MTKRQLAERDPPLTDSRHGLVGQCECKGLELACALLELDSGFSFEDCLFFILRQCPDAVLAVKNGEAYGAANRFSQSWGEPH